MNKAVSLILLMSFMLLSCKTAKQKRCEELQLRPTININTYNELINYENETREVSLFVLDGKVASKEIIEKLILNNPEFSIIEIQSVFGADGKTLDGESKRVLIVRSSSCKEWVINEGEPIFK